MTACEGYSFLKQTTAKGEICDPSGNLTEVCGECLFQRALVQDVHDMQPFLTGQVPSLESNENEDL